MNQINKVIIVGCAAVAGILACEGASTLSLNGKTYALTTNSYNYNADWEAAVDAEFGESATVADFATLKVDAVGLETTLWGFLADNLGGTTGSAFLEYNGSPSVSGYGYFLELHSVFPGGGWYVADYIDPGTAGYGTVAGDVGRIDLGRWTGTKKILTVVSTAPVPEPTAALTCGILAAGSLLRRRRA